MNEQILTWSQAVGRFNPEMDPVAKKDLSSLLTKARQSGIGRQISFQKTAFTDPQLSQIRTLCNWWQLLGRTSIPEFRDKNCCSQIQDSLITALTNQKPLLIYSVFCPSYKKGYLATGYTGKVGTHTEKMITGLVDFITASNEILPTRGIAYFSDLLLENYPALAGTSYREDLEHNYQDFQDKFLHTDRGHLIDTKLLSSIPQLSSAIGESGITSGPIPLSDDIFQIVKSRNQVFYQNVLGWNESQVQERTSILARCYAYMGDVFRQIHPNAIMFWTESAYERGRMYSGQNQDCPLPIIYPQKPNDDS